MSYKPDPSKNVNLTINGIPVTVPEGTRILEAAKKVNIKIPVLCEHPELCRRAYCRICVVEGDGKGKLLAACANDVWEGVKIVTNNARLVGVRKTILELVLANHPQDCLYCSRNKNCELQLLAEEYGIRSSPYERSAEESPATIESDTLVRDMSKCVKCARCVEACQEVQTIRAINTSHRSHEFGISAPYKQALEESSCVFCGKCSSVCPVGAIYGHDQSAEVLDLVTKEEKAIAQISPDVAAALEKEFACCEGGCVTTGKIVAALKLIGFKKVYDEKTAASISNNELTSKLEKRIKTGASAKLPMISGSSEGVSRFVKNFYPDLADHLANVRCKRRIFAEVIHEAYAASEKADASSVTTVSFVPNIAQKYGAGGRKDFALTAAELARMIKLAGINLCSLKEEQFDTIKIDLPPQSSKAKPEIVSGFANARKVMESIRSGKCKAQWIEIES